MRIFDATKITYEDVESRERKRITSATSLNTDKGSISSLDSIIQYSSDVTLR